MLLFQAFVLFLIVSISYGRIDLNVRCATPYQASFSGDKCWMLVSIPMNFIEAAQYCRSFEGNLTSIHSAFDNIYLADLTKFFSHDFYYIGLTNLNDRKTWEWMDGSVMDFADWGNYEPIDGILNNCLVVGVGHGIWHTHDCTTASPFVCEVPEDHSLPTTPAVPPTTTRTSWNISTLNVRTTTASQNWSTTTTNVPKTTPPQNWNTSTINFRTSAVPQNWNTSTVIVSMSTVSSNGSTTAIVFNNSSPAAPMTSTAATISIKPPTVTAPHVPDNATPSPTPTFTIKNGTTAPFSAPSADNTNSHADKDPSSTPKRFPQESSTHSVASGASSNRLFNSLLTSIAVGKAAEYFPRQNSGKQHPRFKSYRQH